MKSDRCNYWSYYHYPQEHLGPICNPVQEPIPLPKEQELERHIGYSDNQQIPVDNPPILKPIKPHLPPKHTQIKPRCFTCKHFEMCHFKKDYLKTVTLLQRDLGAPQWDYEMVTNYIKIPEFEGFPFKDEEKYFPETIEFDNADEQGKLFLAKFEGVNYVKVVYMAKKYYILIKLEYNKESELYELKSCYEAFFKTEYELNQKSLEDIQLKLIDWRNVIINTKVPPLPPHHPDIINTTHFTAALECDMYEWNKKSFEKSIEELSKRYPCGIPISKDDKMLYHIATYHVAADDVPYAPLYIQKKEKPKKPPVRRGDM